MESLDDTPWDVIISGTGLQQSMLALALSRSGKKILHVDKNKYYGGAEAALTTTEAEEWADSVTREPGSSPFESASIVSHVSEGLSSKAYTLSLTPQVMYGKTAFLSSLISSKAFRQLEFLAMGSWWLYQPVSQDGGTDGGSGGGGSDDDSQGPSRNLTRIPGGREDVFSDKTLPMKAKRSLIRFLRNLMQPPNVDRDGNEGGKEKPTDSQAPNDGINDNNNGDDDDDDDDDMKMPFSEYMHSKYQLAHSLCDSLVSLSLSLDSAAKISAKNACQGIRRHLSSMGMFGSGFSAVLPKWGGPSEVAQVGCRACAVGGGVYALDRGIAKIEPSSAADGNKDTPDSYHIVHLSDGTVLQAKYVVGSQYDLPDCGISPPSPDLVKVARSVTIVGSPLHSLFPRVAENGHIPGATVIFFPGEPPVYLLIHSSETGECPAGQSSIYGTTSLPGEEGQARIQSSIDQLLGSFSVKPTVLWSLRYTQMGCAAGSSSKHEPTPVLSSSKSDSIYAFPLPSLALSFDDGIIEQTRQIWAKIMGEEAGPPPTSSSSSFMDFDDRQEMEGLDDEA